MVVMRKPAHTTSAFMRTIMSRIMKEFGSNLEPWFRGTVTDIMSDGTVQVQRPGYDAPDGETYRRIGIPVWIGDDVFVCKVNGGRPVVIGAFDGQQRILGEAFRTTTVSTTSNGSPTNNAGLSFGVTVTHEVRVRAEFRSRGCASSTDTGLVTVVIFRNGVQICDAFALITAVNVPRPHGPCWEEPILTPGTHTFSVGFWTAIGASGGNSQISATPNSPARLIVKEA